MLNYGHGVLYSMVEKACIIAGLDPYIGVLHTDNYNNKHRGDVDPLGEHICWSSNAGVFLFAPLIENDKILDIVNPIPEREKAKKRVNPKVTCQTNRDFKRGYMVEIKKINERGYTTKEGWRIQMEI
jgi:hypothetical protein